MKSNLAKRKLQSLESRKKIFDTALSMIKKGGFDNVSIQDICSEAKVSRGLFYNYFPSKDQILLEKILEVDTYYKNIAEKELRNYAGIDKLFKFVEILFRYVKYRIGGRDFFRNAYRSFLATNKSGKMLTNKDRFFFTLLTEIIEEAREKGELPGDLNTQKVVNQLAIIIWGLCFTWCLYERGFDVENEAIAIITTFLKGLNAEAVSDSSTG